MRVSPFLGVLVLLPLMALFPELSGNAQDVSAPSVAEVSERLDRLLQSESSVGRVELQVVTPRRERTLAMRVWSRGMDRSLIVIESPARERGTATLRVERNLWNYLPRISRTMRVPPSMMLGSWMGSDFTNDDLVRDLLSSATSSASLASDRNLLAAGFMHSMRVREWSDSGSGLNT